MFAAHLQKAVDSFRGITHRPHALRRGGIPPLGLPAAPQRRGTTFLELQFPNL